MTIVRDASDTVVRATQRATPRTWLIRGVPAQHRQRRECSRCGGTDRLQHVVVSTDFFGKRITRTVALCFSCAMAQGMAW